MESFFATLFENVRHERSLIFLLTLTNRDIFKESGFMDLELSLLRSLAWEKLDRQKTLNEYFGLQY